jgi:hypothetical protein
VARSYTTVAQRLGHANANVTLSIYAHALEADELAAAKIWDDALARVIEAHRGELNINLGKSRKPDQNIGQVIDKCGGDDGARTRDLRRDRPAF